MEISAKVTGQEPVTVNYDMPDTLEGLVEKFGEDGVYGKAVDALVIDIQALIRRHSVPKTDKEGKVTSAAKTPDEVQALVNAWKPGAGHVKKSPTEKIASLLAGMSPEDKAKLLEQLRG